MHLSVPFMSLYRKSRPTCTLSLAHVSACKPESTVQVELDLSTIHFVVVPMPPAVPKRNNTKSTTTTKTRIPNDINVIPFPTSAQTTPTGPTTVSQSPNSFKRRPVSKKRDHAPRKRTSPTSTSPPPRPLPISSPPPLSPSSQLPPPPQQEQPIPPPPSLQLPPPPPPPPQQERIPPPLSPSSQALPPPQQVQKSCMPPPPSPQLLPPPQQQEQVQKSRIPPPSSQLPPPPPPPPQQQEEQRKSRIPPSELRFFIFLYRTVVSGLEARQQNRFNTQQVHRTRDGSRREQHLDGVLVEVDDDDDVDVEVKSATNEQLSLNEDLEAQDALLALRLRGFLKCNGVEEWMLKGDASSSSPRSPVNPFLEECKMDVDVLPPPLPIVSNRHLITVLRLRGGGGRTSGGTVGVKFQRNKSKLRTCAYKEDDEGDD